ncbi:MAG: hypothetical protein GYA51_00045 [Candidatus Methanofastidiosa archaeon]|nr:hypothetical protein [Candidatus Methanofastidiosa archaeon]
MPVLPTLNEEDNEKKKVPLEERLPYLLPKVDDDSYEFDLIQDIKYFGMIILIIVVIMLIYLQN